MVFAGDSFHNKEKRNAKQMKVVEKQRQLLATGSLASGVSYPHVTLTHRHTDTLTHRWLHLLVLVLVLVLLVTKHLHHYELCAVKLPVRRTAALPNEQLTSSSIDLDRCIDS